MPLVIREVEQLFIGICSTDSVNHQFIFLAHFLSVIFHFLMDLQELFLHSEHLIFSSFIGDIFPLFLSGCLCCLLSH